MVETGARTGTGAGTGTGTASTGPIGIAPADASVAVGALEITYDDRGAGEPPFVLVHGFTGSRDDWTDHLDGLAAERRVVAPDQRGHGTSTNPGAPAGYTFETLAADLLGFLDALGIDRCDLLGHSMGGMVAMRAVLGAPERFRSLVLMATSARPPDGISPDLFAAGGAIAREQGMEGLVAVLESLEEATPERAAVAALWGAERQRARARDKLLRMDPEAFAELGMALCLHEPVFDRLGGITCSTTVLVGSQDRPMVQPSREMAAAIPDATLVVIEGAWHSPQLSHPGEWRTAIDGHLARAAS